MESSNTSRDLMISNSVDDWQSSGAHNGNLNNAVHNSKSNETETESAGPSIIHKQSECNDDSGYTVTCTVSMALAVPKGYEDDPVMTAEKERQFNKIPSKCSTEAPKTQACYHIEYNLLPDDSKPIKVDLVIYGLMAKVYMDNETKVLKTWQEGDHLWVGWSQSVKLSVTRELLIKMSSHKIIFRLWDTRDKVSPKAKYERPKAFRLPQGKRSEDPDQRGSSLDHELKSAGGIQGMVFKLRALYEKQNLVTTTSKMCQKDIKPMGYEPPSKLKFATENPKLPTTDASQVSENPFSSIVRNTDGLLRQESAFSNQSYGGKQNPKRTKNIKSEATVDQEKDMALYKLAWKLLTNCTKHTKDTTAVSSTKSSTMKDSSLVMVKKKHANKPVQERATEEDIHKNGVASAEFKAMDLLAGKTLLIDCMMIRSRSVSAVLCSITLDQPLMSEELKAELNPLIITILSASSLPSTPAPFFELEQKRMPVYCQYKFHNMPAHKTKGLGHASKLYFKDVNVILTGLLSNEELFEFLRGPPLEIEVHDFDRKAEEPSSSPAIFGTEATDDQLASTAIAPTRQTSYTSFREMRKFCDQYGVAILNLSDLLKGHRCLKFSLPIRGSHPVQSLATDKNECGGNKPENADALDTQDYALPSDHYLKANSKLKVQVEIAHPLSPDPDKREGHCPFGRIIYIFKYSNTDFLEQLRSEILRINAVAFQVHSNNKETVQRILQRHVMDATERENKYLTALTGVHILDKALHLFIIEGPKDETIKKLWEAIPIKLVEDVEKHVTVLHNSGLSFSKRLYDTLDVGLSPIYLYKPLETIVRQPLVYIRNTVNYTCLQAMLRINHLCQMSKLEEVSQNNLFPSAEMILSLRNEFGVTASRGLERLMPDISESKVIVHPHVTQRRPYTPIDNFNKDYLAWKRSQTNQGLYIKNYIKTNIEDIQRATSLSEMTKPRVFEAKVDDGQFVHNYSIQTMNCTSLAKKMLYKEIAKEPARRFTYSQHYQSFTVDPVDIEAENKALEARSRAAWRTYNGFSCYDFKDSMESNRHPKHPDEARVEELKKPWKENILHGNIFKPVLNRTTWPWSKRHKDFQLYTKPPAVLSPVPPITIHLAGEALHQEQLQAAHAQYVRWRSKILPNKESASSGRVPEFKCHMQRTGLDKLQDILKDKPMKLSLRAWKGSMIMPYTNMQKENNLKRICLSDTQLSARHARKHSTS